MDGRSIGNDNDLQDNLSKVGQTGNVGYGKIKGDVMLWGRSCQPYLNMHDSGFATSCDSCPHQSL